MKKFTSLMLFLLFGVFAFSQEVQVFNSNLNELAVKNTDIRTMQVEPDGMDIDWIEGSGGFFYGPPLIEMTYYCETYELYYFFYMLNMYPEVIYVTVFIEHFTWPQLGTLEIFSGDLIPGVTYSINHLISYANPVPPGIYYSHIIFVTSEPGNPQYIIPVTYTVMGSAQPLAAFTADQTYIYENDTVGFTDLSENNPASWQWSFQGGIPATSSEQHPQVVYPYYGTYNVQLKVTNECGQDILFKSEYILVDFASGNQQPVPESGINVFPNPSEGIFYIDVRGEQEFSYSVMDLSGRVVAGSNWTLNRTIDLSEKTPGLYFLEIIKPDGMVNRTRLMIVR
jgi:hypothetical protein